MSSMTTSQPPLPIPGTWQLLTRKRAAEILGCSQRTITRMIEAKKIAAYAPIGATGETVPTLLFEPDVQDMARARARVSGKG